MRKAVADSNTGSVEISFYNDAADEISDGKCYKISDLTLNTYESKRILKSSVRTEVALVRITQYCSSWNDTNVRKKNER